MDLVKGKIISIVPKPSFRITIIALLIISVQIIVSLVTYPLLPKIVPSHWNAIGQVDAYAPKLLVAILWPLTSTILYSLLLIALVIGPRLGLHHPGKTQAIVQLLSLATLLFLLVMQLTVISLALGFRIDITFVVSLTVSILFVFIGNYLGKLRRNYWAGIRTPWTLASDVVWERTHRFGGWVFVGAGVLGILVSFMPIAHIWGMMLVILIASIILVVYSYKVYRHQKML